MCYCLQVIKVIGVEHDKDSSSRESSSSKSKRSDRDKSDSSKGSNSGVDMKHDVKFRDCQKLVTFNAKQKQWLREMWELLQAKEDKEELVRKMTALSVSFILQSLKGFDQFDSLIVHFAAVLGINKEGAWLRKGKECSFVIAGFLYCIWVLFVKHTLLAVTRAEQMQVDINRFLEL
jgi:hypothetical protein